ncbi:hypothetical protein EBBID32_10560 [Sphingobium indicum BiD32]|uniref:Uncharacterized protein n=1 Tax=Sphingobium indicum BiD32 TaxID=1301087 RepID=N1MMM8_9SPHN|nr:hypothetical protein [Sphingobium indicum]CCW16718.1 hypothetical protein EBBID32_10560 [Sphingobium indicum BiD32]
MSIDLPMNDPWADHPDHPVADWQAEVANSDTRLGYWAWVVARDEEAQTQASLLPHGTVLHRVAQPPPPIPTRAGEFFYPSPPSGPADAGPFSRLEMSYDHYRTIDL